MKRICLLFALMLSGCASNTYYFPVVKKPAAAPVLEKKGKIDITYSVAFVRPSYADAFSSDAAEQDEKKHRKLIYDKLKKSGLFNKITYVFPRKRGKYHLHFGRATGGTSEQMKMGWAMVSAETLFLFPISFHMTFDHSMQMFVDGVEVYAVMLPIKNRTVFWAPLVLLMPTLFVSKSRAQEYPLDFFINEIVKNELYSAAALNGRL